MLRHRVAVQGSDTRYIVALKGNYSEQAYEIDELAARLHYQLVLVHPWPNGNGRWTRLVPDMLLQAERRPRFLGWRDLVRATEARIHYSAALKAADRGDFGPLLAFVRR